MLTAFNSYRRKKQAKINAKMANMRAAKERKRLQAPAPDYPLDRHFDYQEIVIRGMHMGRYREITYALLPSKNGRADQYDVLGAGSNYLGTMGADKVFDEIRKREFVRVRAS